MSGLLVKHPGILSLLQDSGREGMHRFGLTAGGPMDSEAFYWANRLCDNQPGATALEITVGGLVVEAQHSVKVAVTGAVAALEVNGKACEQWRSYQLKQGDQLSIGYASSGVRIYLAVAGGFQIKPQFGSTATVVREGIGGLNGQSLQAGDELTCQHCEVRNNWLLPEMYRPKYTDNLVLRMVLGYQQEYFPSSQQQIFFSGRYKVSANSDRMGYRLNGPPVKAEIEGILSEGLCHGAIQIPADGQPIILLNDRQTIGGYPKMGAVIALDTAKLSQLMPGSHVSFESISLKYANNLNTLARNRLERTELHEC